MIDGFTTPENHLRALFQRAVANRTLDFSSITISVNTDDHSEVIVKPRSPEHAARYMRYFFNTKEPMFQREVMTLSSGQTLPTPLVFKIGGLTYEPSTRLNFYVQMLRIRFFQTGQASELSFDFNYCREDWNELTSGPYAGPEAFEFIRMLEKGGSSWNNMLRDAHNLDTTQRTPHLHIVT